MSMNLQVRQRPSLQRITFLERLALFGGDSFNLTLTRKSRRFLGRLHARSEVSLNASLRCSVYHGSEDQWRGGSEAAGEAARLMAPPAPVILFCLFVWDASSGLVSCHRHNMQ